MDPHARRTDIPGAQPGRETPSPDGRISRRMALSYAAAAGTAALLTACDPIPSSPGRAFAPPETAPFKAFMFIHDETVQVLITEHDDIDKFTLIVRKDGREAERYEGLTDKTVGDISSPLIRVAYINPPS